MAKRASVELANEGTVIRPLPRRSSSQIRGDLARGIFRGAHQLERRLAVSPWLNEDVQDLAFAVHGIPDVQLSAVETPL